MAEPKKETFTPTLTSDVLNILNCKRGLTSEKQLRAITAGELSVPPARRCVGAIGYDSQGKILLVTFTDGFTIDRTSAENLSEFGDQFRIAANYGHSVAIVSNLKKKRIEFLQIVASECPCNVEGRAVIRQFEPREVRTQEPESTGDCHGLVE